MNKLLVKKDISLQISREEFLEDVGCLFEVLQTSYGMYDYFGHERFVAARAAVIHRLNEVPFDARNAVSVLKNEFASFIKDGHFRIGVADPADPVSDFAVRHTDFHGIPMIVCRKFWYDSREEQEQLERFAASYTAYRDAETLIIDVRDNLGGSDVYIWDFLKGLYGAEPDYPCRYVQRNSALFREYAAAWDLTSRPDLEQTECDGVRIPSRRRIYVLINEGTASSGESAIAYLKTIDNTVVVGDHSAGCFTCGNCMTVYLPHSHLPVYFGTGMVLYEKTRNMDAEGGFRGDISYEAFAERVAPISP